MVRSVDQSSLIRARSAVRQVHPRARDARLTHHSVVNGEVQEKTVEILEVRVRLVGQLAVEVVVNEVDVGSDPGPLRGDRLRRNRLPHLAEHTTTNLRQPLTVGDPKDTTLPEFHSISGQRTRLVGKYILHLAKLFIQVGRPHSGQRAVVEHILVHRDHESLHELDHSEGHDQGNRNKIAENNEKSQKLENTVPKQAPELLLLRVQVALLQRDGPFEDCPPGPTNYTADELKAEDDKHQAVGLLLQGGLLVRRLG
mmetsp:Transcript_77698/g.177929  ORF Transcript_77698/g.177929 Transcript_77698/m.177929 type:complete len:255 (+) Transcript_77698:1135-1899(+)